MVRPYLPHKHPPAEPLPGLLQMSRYLSQVPCWNARVHNRIGQRGETEAHAGHRQRKDMDYAVTRLGLYRKDTHTPLQTLPEK